MKNYIILLFIIPYIFLLGCCGKSKVKEYGYVGIVNNNESNNYSEISILAEESIEIKDDYIVNESSSLGSDKSSKSYNYYLLIFIFAIFFILICLYFYTRKKLLFRHNR